MALKKLEKCDDRGSMMFLMFLLCCFTVYGVPLVNADGAPGICTMKKCTCNIVGHWVIIKCVFDNDEVVDLQEQTIPKEAIEVNISNCKALKIHSGAFPVGVVLRSFNVSGIRDLIVDAEAFPNSSAPITRFEVSKCNSVVIESYAFTDANGTLNVKISKCNRVTIKPNAFFRLLTLRVENVSELELSQNAFQFTNTNYGKHGPATKIEFHSVQMKELPTMAFPSNIYGIEMNCVKINTIRPEAFSAMTMRKIKINNARIEKIESRAFSERSLITSIDFVDVHLESIDRDALRSTYNTFTMNHSRLPEMREGSINIMVNVITLSHNVFETLHQRAILLNGINSITIDHNLFEDLKMESIVPNLVTQNRLEKFSFIENQINQAEGGSLKFTTIVKDVVNGRIGNNYFQMKCNCNFADWMKNITGNDIFLSQIMDTSFCKIDETLNRCLNASDNNLLAKNYTELMCVKSKSHPPCVISRKKETTSVNREPFGPRNFSNQYLNVDWTDEESSRHSMIINIVKITAITVFSLIVIVLLIIFLCRRGYYPKIISEQRMDFMNYWLSPNGGMTAATSAGSISRLNVQEYAGLQTTTTTTTTTNTETTMLNAETTPDVIEYTEDPEQIGLYAVSTENKTTQTLPEELTEEYLKDLRERLNDPYYYDQARDMIEHLYDLIKVEENCNNNNDRQLNEEDNAYDVIELRSRLPRNEIVRTSISIGTKTPSLDKLLPNGLITKFMISEYAEPRDRKTNKDQNHLYTELPGDETVPSTSRLTRSIIFSKDHQPDVVNDHLINQTDEVYDYAVPEKYNNVKNNNQKSSNFFNTVSCEYAEPCDTANHLYSELAEPRVNSIGKMANRPLPIKPDQKRVQSLTH